MRLFSENHVILVSNWALTKYRTSYTATAEQVEEIRRESLARYGIPYVEAERNVQETLGKDEQEPSPDRIVPPYEVVAV